MSQSLRESGRSVRKRLSGLKMVCPNASSQSLRESERSVQFVAPAVKAQIDPGRNPFVNQVVPFAPGCRHKKGEDYAGSQSLRESGRSVPKAIEKNEPSVYAVAIPS